MNEQAKPNRLLELNRELRASQSLQVVDRLFVFGQSLRIFLANASDLEAAVRSHVAGDLVDIRDKRGQQRVQNELFTITMHLHNTVAAALSLIDHTRAFYE